MPSAENASDAPLRVKTGMIISYTITRMGLDGHDVRRIMTL